VAIEVRTPSSSSLEYARLKVESAATLARTLPETKATNSYVNPGGGRIYVDIGKSTERRARRWPSRPSLRRQTARLVGAEYVVLEDLNNGAQKPVQIRFTGPDSRQLLELTNRFMAQLRQVPGAVDVGLSEQDPQAETEDRAGPRAGQFAGHHGGNDAAQACAWPLPASRWATGWTRPARRATWRCACTPTTVWTWQHRTPAHRRDAAANRMVPLEQIATVTMGKGPSQIQHADGKRTISVAANAQGRSPGEVTADA
jgi:HAE1 family hydrophobic/amphiphilic exporter-1